MSTREVVVVSGARTAIGGYGGSLKDTPPTKLGAIAIKEAVARALRRTHAMLDVDQRKQLAYLLRSGQLTI